MRKPEARAVQEEQEFRDLLDRLVVRSLLGIQEAQKGAQELAKEEATWSDTMSTLAGLGGRLKTGQVAICCRWCFAVIKLC